jgi:hypothetical protein
MIMNKLMSIKLKDNRIIKVYLIKSIVHTRINLNWISMKMYQHNIYHLLKLKLIKYT